MQVLAIDTPRSNFLIIITTIAVSVLVGSALGAGRAGLLIAPGAVLLFTLLAWDLRIVVPILIVVLPFGPKFPMSFGNLYLATAIVIIAYAAWIWRNPLLPNPFRLPANPIVGAIAILLAVMSISSLQSLSFLLSNQLYLLRFVQFFLYTSFFVVLLQMPFSKSDIRGLLKLVILAGVVEGFIGIWQWQTNPGIYVTGTFDWRHNNYAIYIIFVTLLLLGVLLESKSRRSMAACALGIGVLLYSIVFSFSRAGYISFGVSLIALVLMPLRRGAKIFFSVACVTAVLIIYLLVPPDVVYRARDILSTVTGRQIALSFVSRLDMWRDALSDFLRNPILGKGTWSYGLRDNFFVKLLGEAGILGFLSLVGLLYVLVKEQWRAIKARTEDDFVRGIAVGLFPATIGCLIVFNLSGDFFIVHRFMGTFWIVLALTLNYCLGSGTGVCKDDGPHH